MYLELVLDQIQYIILSILGTTSIYIKSTSGNTLIQHSSNKSLKKYNIQRITTALRNYSISKSSATGKLQLSEVSVHVALYAVGL